MWCLAWLALDLERDTPDRAGRLLGIILLRLWKLLHCRFPSTCQPKSRYAYPKIGAGRDGGQFERMPDSRPPIGQYVFHLKVKAQRFELASYTPKLRILYIFGVSRLSSRYGK